MLLETNRWYSLVTPRCDYQIQFKQYPFEDTVGGQLFPDLVRDYFVFRSIGGLTHGTTKKSPMLWVNISYILISRVNITDHEKVNDQVMSSSVTDRRFHVWTSHSLDEINKIAQVINGRDLLTQLSRTKSLALFLLIFRSFTQLWLLQSFQLYPFSAIILSGTVCLPATAPCSKQR